MKYLQQPFDFNEVPSSVIVRENAPQGDLLCEIYWSLLVFRPEVWNSPEEWPFLRLVVYGYVKKLFSPGAIVRETWNKVVNVDNLREFLLKHEKVCIRACDEFRLKYPGYFEDSGGGYDGAGYLRILIG